MFSVDRKTTEMELKYSNSTVLLQAVRYLPADRSEHPAGKGASLSAAAIKRKALCQCAELLQSTARATELRETPRSLETQNGKLLSGSCTSSVWFLKLLEMAFER